jgi:hypothetical protein
MQKLPYRLVATYGKSACKRQLAEKVYESETDNYGKRKVILVTPQVGGPNSILFQKSKSCTCRNCFLLYILSTMDTDYEGQLFLNEDLIA